MSEPIRYCNAIGCCNMIGPKFQLCLLHYNRLTRDLQGQLARACFTAYNAASFNLALGNCVSHLAKLDGLSPDNYFSNEATRLGAANSPTLKRTVVKGPKYGKPF